MISVALPVIKLGHFAEALASVLDQTYQDLEVIVVDNAADGDVPAVLAARPDPRVRYVRHESRLPAVANWNRCLEYATGDWFVLASDDDRYEPEFLASVTEVAGRHPRCRLLHTRVKVIDEAGQVLRYAPACPEWESGLDFVWHRVAFLREQFLSDFVYHTGTLRQVGGFVDLPGGWFTDEATSFAAAMVGGVACAPVAAFCYRESSANLTGSTAVAHKLEATDAYAAWMERLLASPDFLAGDPVLRAAIGAQVPRRIRHLKYRELLLASGRRPWTAAALLARHRRRHGLSWRGLLLAGIAALVRQERQRS